MRRAETRKRTGRAAAMLSVLLFLPGCPELQQELVIAVENATQAWFERNITGFFDQFRPDT